MMTRTAPTARCSSSRRSSSMPVQCGLRFFSPLRVGTPQKPAKTSSSPSRGGVRVHSPAARHSSGSPVLDRPATIVAGKPALKYHGVHHVALLVKDLQRSLDFYQGILGLEVNPDRPHSKLPYPGAWLWIGPEMIHLMELDNPDPMGGRPEHGGRDRHVCVGVTDIKPLVERLDAHGIAFTMSKSGRPAVFFRDPDMNCMEVVEQEPWR